MILGLTIYLFWAEIVWSRYLPGRYKNYDLYNGYKVFKTIITAKHLIHIIKQHKVKYYKGYKGKPQRSIGQRQTKHNNYSKASNTNHKKECW
jgi:hypothetical protein